MEHCSICKRPLDTGRIEDSDCGGDCLECMGDAGDPAASRAFMEEIKAMRKDMREIADMMFEHPDQRQGNSRVHWVYHKALSWANKEK